MKIQVTWETDGAVSGVPPGIIEIPDSVYEEGFTQDAAVSDWLSDTHDWLVSDWRTLPTYGDADTIKIECDERGFELHVETDEGDRFAFNIHGCAEALHEQVNLIIGGWLAEGERARHSVRVTREDLDAYELNDPKRASLEILLDGKDEVFV